MCKIQRLAVLRILTAAIVSSSAHGAVTSLSVDGSGNILDVVIQRGAGSYTYAVGELVGIDLGEINGKESRGHFVADGAAMPGGLAANAGAARDALLEDFNVTTGFANIQDNPILEGINSPGSMPAAVGMVIHFLTPVINHAGADAIFLEIASGAQTADPVAVSTSPFTTDTDGFAFTNSSADLVTGLNFDRYLAPSEIENLDNFRNFSLSTPDDLTGFDIMAVEIDFSDLGVADGATVTSLYIRSSSTNFADPVAIFGLPAIPEPGSLALAGLSMAIGMLRRRR